MSVDEATQFYIWYKKPEIFFEDVFKRKPYPYQEKVLKEFKDLTRILVCSAADTGKTILLACIALWSATVLPVFLERKYDVIIISGGKEQAKWLYDYCRDALSDNPILMELVEGEPRITITRFKDRSTIRALAKSMISIQGKHADLVVIDEAAFPELDFYIRDALRIISPTPYSRILISSSPHEYDSLFVDMWENKKKYPDYTKDNPLSWKRYSWSGFECPRTLKKIEEARQLPQDMFEKYYMGKPYPILGTMIDLDLIKKASEGNPIFKIRKDELGHALGTIIAGLDWGFGKDPTVITIVQIINRVRYILFVKEFKEENPENIDNWIKANIPVFHISKIFADAQNKSENMRLISMGVAVFPIAFGVGFEKEKMKANLRALFQNGLIKIPEDFIKLKYQLSRYTWNTNTNDDYVDSLMLACRRIEEDIEGEEDISYIIVKPKRKKYF